MMHRNRLLLLLLATSLAASGCAHVPGLGSDEPKSGGHDRAELERLSVEQSDAAIWPFRLAEIAAASGDAVGAEAHLNDALSRDPNHLPSISLLSKLWWQTARHDEAIVLLEAARAAGPVPDDLIVALALHYQAVDEEASAAALLAGVSHAPSVDAWRQLRGEDFEHAEDVARRALESDPHSAANQNNWGITRLYAGEPEAARKAFLTAVELDPDLPGPLYNLAIVDRFYRFDEDSARDWFRRYRTLSDEDPDGLAELLAVQDVANADEGDTP